MKRVSYKAILNSELSHLNNPKLKCVKDEIDGKTYSLCLMQSDSLNEKRIIRHISEYMSPKELIAFIKGYRQALTDNCFD